MAGQDESLKLSAEIVNGASPVLKDLQRSLRAIADEARRLSSVLTQIG
jgi:hypothetical protein